MRELEELLAIRDQLENKIEGGFRYGFWTIYSRPRFEDTPRFFGGGCLQRGEVSSGFRGH